MTVSGHTFCGLDWRILYVNKGGRMKPTYEEKLETVHVEGPHASCSRPLLCSEGPLRQTPQHPHHEHPQQLRRIQVTRCLQSRRYLHTSSAWTP